MFRTTEEAKVYCERHNYMVLEEHPEKLIILDRSMNRKVIPIFLGDRNDECNADK